ncbi:hypothetical protein O6H91_11G045200 [Diphasiastrum complanatum]|uniref:Uncharacterized protein n=1 Tax=Diphasiastrum complanatum TaxID=34168 RepID=A0ACC2C8M2_DIPCM|nr:hypothetical protein O6H91_11G045200 [Diphasiastrum complanatum]
MEAAPKLGSKKKVEMFLNKMSKSPIFLVILTALLSSSSKNVVPSLRFLFVLLASQFQDSLEAQQAGLFVLVNFIVLAILVRSTPVSSQAIQVVPTQSRRHPSRRSRRQWASSSSYPDFTNEVHETATVEEQLPDTTKKAPSRSSSMGKRSASYPLLSAARDGRDEISTPGTETTPPQNSNKQEQVAVYKDDLVERIELFLSRNREQWEKQRQESLERRRRHYYFQG